MILSTEHDGERKLAIFCDAWELCLTRLALRDSTELKSVCDQRSHVNHQPSVLLDVPDGCGGKVGTRLCASSNRAS